MKNHRLNPTPTVFVLPVLFAFVVLNMLNIPSAHGFSLFSPQLKENAPMGIEQVLNGFGCNGKNISPELGWTDPPKGTRSFALTVYDPDAPTGSGWWHWVLFNIKPGVRALGQNAGDPKAGPAPAGSVQGMTDFGKPGYGGACPPEGDKPHRYVFTLYALDTDALPLDGSAPAAMVGYFIHQHEIAHARMTVKYSR